MWALSGGTKPPRGPYGFLDTTHGGALFAFRFGLTFVCFSALTPTILTIAALVSRGCVCRRRGECVAALQFEQPKS